MNAEIDVKVIQFPYYELQIRLIFAKKKRCNSIIFELTTIMTSSTNYS